MQAWPVQDAKARFSEMLDTCIASGPQLVTRRGADAAVLVPVEEWRRVSERGQPTLQDWLLSDGPRFELDIPPPADLNRRAPLDFSDD